MPDVGSRVRPVARDHGGHTRLVRYIHGRVGTVVAIHGEALVPDRMLKGEPGEPETVYAVRFSSEDLWGVPGHTVTIDMWQSYLDEK